MSHSLPPYEKIVRWSVRDVTEWLKEANLTEFKDQFNKKSIDGNKLANLSEYDVNNFTGKNKKKSELNNYLSRIKKPTTQTSAWISPAATNKKNDEEEEDGDNDSIYSWGDDFEDKGDEEESDEESDENDQNYIEPPASNAPEIPRNRRNPAPVPTVPLLPGQRPVEPSNHNTKGSKSLPRIARPAADTVDEVKKTTTRRPPPPPPVAIEEPEQELYINDTMIPSHDNPPPPFPAEQDGYILFNGGVNQDQEENYVLPEEESIPTRVQKSATLPPIPTWQNSNDRSSTKTKNNTITKQRTPKVIDSEVRALPPTPGRNVQSKRKTSNTKIPKPPVQHQNSDDELEALYSYNWYHSNADRTQAESRLREENHNGMYLVRRSLKGGMVHPYTLMVYYDKKTYNFPIRRRESDKKFALGKEGQNKNDLLFDSVDQLIAKFNEEPLLLNPQLNHQKQTRLTRPLTKL